MDQQQNTTPPQYFLNNEFTSPKQNLFMEKVKKLWNAFQYYARQAWPYVNRLLNFIFYQIIKVIKGIVKIASEQITKW